jgi:peptide-methionine (S)-S-oxide reductase
MRHITRRLILGTVLLAGLGSAALSQGSGQTQAPGSDTATAILAGGCFWCVEADFDKVPGVLSTTSGYIGGRVANPTYEQVSSSDTGHVEAVRIVYDPSKVTYEALLQHFWRNVDPLTANAQFCDRGPQYRSAIFALDDRQKQLAEASKAAVEKRFAPRRVATEINSAATFYPAEDYHQDYYKKNEVKYKFYRWNCGRDARLQEVWGAEAGGLAKSS